MYFPLYKDVTKNATELLKKGYPSSEKYAFKVEFDSTSSSGLQATPWIAENQDKTIEAELKTKFPLRDFTVTTTGNLKEDVSFEISPAKNYSNGFKWTANLNTNLTNVSDKAKGKVTLELKNEKLTSNLVFEAPLRQSGGKSDDSKLTANAVFGSKEKGLSTGFETEFSLSSFSLKNVNTTVSYNKDDSEAAIFTKTKLGGSTNVGANYIHKLSNSSWRDTQLGAEVSYDINDKSSSFTLGASYKPSDSSTLKTRFDSKGLLGFVYTEKWNGPLSVTFGSDWNVLGAANASPFQYSIKLAFK
jgi:hypothetical protein